MDLKDKLLSGYSYRIRQEGAPTVCTGIGGAQMIIEAFREQGIGDETSATLIEVHLDELGWVPLAHVNVNKKNNDIQDIEA